MNKKIIISKSNTIISKLKVLAKEKEDIRRKLVVTAKQLAVAAEGKESIRIKLEVTAEALRLKAEQLATIAKEKENVRLELVATAEKLSFKAEELAITNVKQEAILASIGDSVMACDKEGLVILFNRKAVAMSGFSAKEVIGKHYDHVVKFVREIDNEPSEDFIAEAMKTGHKTIMADNTLLVRKNGSKIPVADSAEPIRYTHGVLIGCVVVFRDITQEKKTDHAKSEFVSLVSHQLKTPGTIVGLYAEQLLKGSGGELTTKQKEYVNEIRGANQRMTDIVNTLLNISRMEMGIFSVEPTPVDVITVFKNSIKDSHANLYKKHLTLKEEYHQSEHVLSIDTLLLNMVFSNLISNSIKYTSSGGNISVKSSKVKKYEKINSNIVKEDSLLVSVSDNGLGIPTSEQDKIFTKFFRSDNARNEHTDGTGLGLYIVKLILDQIGGDVWFTSQENKGTIFYFTVPLKGTKQKGVHKDN
ncbi:MAG: ATP-binding protein [Candidatus Staskawiczbacteria bacterium]|nr:ATP-binding protein [Candidatus Staskawiczbacteria bacterium]